VAGAAVAIVIAVAAGTEGLVALGAGAATAALLLLFFRSWLGGVTGDTLGATAKLAETAALVGYLAAR
jgi:cobalamin synthase